MCKIQLNNGSIVDIYGYDEIADYLYSRNLEYIWGEGKTDSHMMIEVIFFSIVK